MRRRFPSSPLLVRWLTAKRTFVRKSHRQLSGTNGHRYALRRRHGWEVGNLSPQPLIYACGGHQVPNRSYERGRERASERKRVRDGTRGGESGREQTGERERERTAAEVPRCRCTFHFLGTFDRARTSRPRRMAAPISISEQSSGREWQYTRSCVLRFSPSPSSSLSSSSFFRSGCVCDSVRIRVSLRGIFRWDRREAPPQETGWFFRSRLFESVQWQ